MQQKHSNLFDLKDVQVSGGFWKEKMELVRTEVIPYQWKALNDEIKEAEPSYCMRNYRIAGKIIRGETERKIKKEMVFQPLPSKESGELEDTFYGFAFQDSDFSKWIEAVAYSLTQHEDKELETAVDAAIDVVCQAQQEDGYLDTYFIIRNPDAIFTNLRDYHELYCFGHLTEGAVAYYQATGKTKLLEAVKRYASYIDKRIGSEEGKLHGYPGHEEAELALAKLYEVTGEELYLKLASYFIDARGQRPYYFDLENVKEYVQEVNSTADIDFAGQQTVEERYQYHQAHRPVRNQTEAVGHAVRAVYLYSGMADVARLTKDEELFHSCERLWDNITGKKMYVTGSIGGTHMGEAFSHAYDLPADTAYAETCAAIGFVFFAGRMLQYRPDSKYADVMERALYNGVLSGMALDGRSFFYVNPLECRPQDSQKDVRKQHVKPVRQKWFGCACCPPNLARLISSISRYAFTETEETLFIHLFLDAKIKKEILTCDGSKKKISIDIKGKIPWDGQGSIHVTGLEEKEAVRLAIRVPEWAGEFTVNGHSYQNIDQWTRDGGQTENGYLYLMVEKDCEITWNFTMPIRFIYADPRVRETAGQVTVMRGPVVYCLEEKDNGAELHLLRVDREKKPEMVSDSIHQEKVVLIQTGGWREQYAEGNALYHSNLQGQEIPATLTWIPYYTWANRGENEMRVWVRK